MAVKIPWLVTETKKERQIKKGFLFFHVIRIIFETSEENALELKAI